HPPPNRLPEPSRAGNRQTMSAETLNDANDSSEERTHDPGPPAWNARLDIFLHARLVLQPSFSDCLEYMGVTDLQRRRVPQSFILSLHRRLRNFLNWVKWLYQQEDDFASFSNYKTILAVVFGFLNRTAWSWVGIKTGDIERQISAHLSLDAHTLLAEFIIVLRDAKTYKTFLASRGPVAQRLLDLVQDRPLLSQALLRLSRVSELLPTCFPLVGLAKLGPQVAAGAFGDIWKGSVRDQTVSVKIMRLFRDTDVRAALKEFGREALIWRQLSHPNLLPFYGLYYLDRRLCLVSPWMENGHILDFLKTAPVGLNRVPLILDYLHDEHTNILLTPSGRACIADFGLSTIADAVSLRFTHSTRSARGGTARHQAPELLLGEMQNHYGSDVYAFGWVGYEILTGKAPFYELMNDMAVSIKVIGGSQPSRPDPGPSEILWQLLLDCWEQDSVKRPKVGAITQRLVSLHIGERKCKDAAHWDETFNAKFRRSLHDWPLLPPVDRIRQIVFYNPRDQYYQMPSTSTESPNFPLTRAATSAMQAKLISLPVAGMSSSVLQSMMAGNRLAGNEDLEESAERGRKRRLESPGAQELTKKPKL
ncbi:kinase-like domain-containing protein, partial [Mycena metata]